MTPAAGSDSGGPGSDPSVIFGGCPAHFCCVMRTWHLQKPFTISGDRKRRRTVCVPGAFHVFPQNYTTCPPQPVWHAQLEPHGRDRGNLSDPGQAGHPEAALRPVMGTPHYHQAGSTHLLQTQHPNSTQAPELTCYLTTHPPREGTFPLRQAAP